MEATASGVEIEVTPSGVEIEVTPCEVEATPSDERPKVWACNGVPISLDVPIVPQYEVLDEYTDRMELARVKERLKSRTFLLEQLQSKKEIFRKRNKIRAAMIEKVTGCLPKFEPKFLKKVTLQSRQPRFQKPNRKSVALELARNSK